MKRTPIISVGQVYLHGSPQSVDLSKAQTPTQPAPERNLNQLEVYLDMKSSVEEFSLEEITKELNEYLVVVKSTRGDVQFKGRGFGGMNEVELFLERFGPVDPVDLSVEERNELLELLDKPGLPLLTGWVHIDDDEDDE